ncbi:MAG: hypothetical protein V4550_13240 [Gemmatimonadota bacterium]
MLFTLEVLPAEEGDCLLLHWGTPAAPRLAVIDGGPRRIYEQHLRARLDEIADARGGGRLQLDLVMVSHVDTDHIVGIKKLVREVRQQIDAHTPADEQRYHVRRLWHNTFNDILGDGIDQYFRTFTASYQASVNGKPDAAVVDTLAKQLREDGATEDEAADEAWDVGLLLAGHADGRDLRDDHEVLYNANVSSAPNTPIVDAHGRPTLITRLPHPKAVTVDGLKITILGPAKEEIEALQAEFDEYIENKGLTAEAVLAAYADDSVTNLSSIVCMVEFDGKRVLLTGDARGDKVLEGLQAAGFVANGDALAVDILKVPHHGSDRNLAPEFFKQVIADTYVLSGDGKHGNPERDTVNWIVASRAKDDMYTIVITYPVDATDTKREADRALKNARRKPANRIQWEPKTDALDSLLSTFRHQGYAFELVAGAPCSIQLGSDSSA